MAYAHTPSDRVAARVYAEAYRASSALDVGHTRQDVAVVARQPIAVRDSDKVVPDVIDSRFLRPQCSWPVDSDPLLCGTS